MPAFSTITLTSIVWTPERMKGDVAFYSDVTDPIVELRPTLSMSVTPPSKTSKLYKVRVKLAIPVADAVTGLYSYENTFDGTFLLPKVSNAASREDLLTAVQELFAEVTGAVFSQVVSLAPIY